jgi:hypothetical protein
LRSPGPRIFVVASLLATMGPGARAAAAQDWTAEAAANRFGPGRTSFDYTVNPGGRVKDGVLIVNRGAARLHLAIRAGGRGIGAWVRSDPGGVTVAPGASAEVPFTLTLPKDVAPGDYAGRLAGIPVRLRVGGPLKPSLAVEDVRIHDARTVTYTIRNTGNATLSARQTVSLSGPFGRWKVNAGKLPDSPPLLPGRTRTVSAPLHDVTPALRLTATVTLTPLLTDAAGSTSPLSAIRATGHAWAIPWPLVPGTIVLVAAGLALRSRRRVRSPAPGGTG